MEVIIEIVQVIFQRAKLLLFSFSVKLVLLLTMNQQNTRGANSQVHTATLPLYLFVLQPNTLIYLPTQRGIITDASSLRQRLLQSHNPRSGEMSAYRRIP